jgi:hypothetical protein
VRSPVAEPRCVQSVATDSSDLDGSDDHLLLFPLVVGSP